MVSWLLAHGEMGYKLIVNGSGLWGTSSNPAHSFLHFHSLSRPPKSWLRAREREAVPTAFPASRHSCRVSVFSCSTLRSLFTLPQPTSVVHFPPRARDDAFLDYISRLQQQSGQSLEPRAEEERPWTWRFKKSGLGTNLPALGKLVRDVTWLQKRLKEGCC